MNTELYYNNDHSAVAVLVSHQYGAGWSSWTDESLAYDARVVRFWLDHKDDKEWMRTVDLTEHANSPESAAHKEAREFFQSIGYEYCPYMGGFPTIELEWVPLGKQWRIEERDGAERLVFPETYDYEVFS